MNYYPFHIGDYISHTSHLTDAEDLAYRRMIDLYYQSEQPFADVEYVARRVKSTPEIISVLLSDFFVKTEDGWRNKRADEEIEKYHAKAESARNANKAKLEKKSALKSELKSEPNQDATNNQEPITNNHIKDITPVGVSESIFKDYLEVRKAKKAKWTQTALKGLQREADKAKMSLQDVMQLCCERSWVGFKAEWANSQDPVSKQGDDKSWMFSNQGIEAKAKELGVNDYGIHNHQQLKDKVLLVMAKKAMQ
jgi:uncharacterized protein YdaU (DUF1376 family)